MKTKILKATHLLGGVLTLCGVALDFLRNEKSKWLFIAGVAILVIVQLFYMFQTKTDDIRKKRLLRLMFLSTVLLGIAAYLMYMGNGYWLVLVLIYALLSIYLATRN